MTSPTNCGGRPTIASVCPSVDSHLIHSRTSCSCILVGLKNKHLQLSYQTSPDNTHVEQAHCVVMSSWWMGCVLVKMVQHPFMLLGQKGASSCHTWHSAIWSRNLLTISRKVTLSHTSSGGWRWMSCPAHCNHPAGR